MENFSRKLEKALKYPAFKITPGETGYHTLMLIGENGKIKHVRILKGLVIALILVQVLVFCAAVYVIYTSRKYVEDNRGLLNALDISQKNYLAMRDEKDMLTARLVLAESMVKGVGAGADKAVPAVNASEKTLASRVEPALQGRVKVSIDNFKVFHEPQMNTLDIQFDLKNAGTDIQYVTGYAFVILKENDIDQNNWLSVPNVPLVSKRPSEIDKGRRFSISRFKQVYFTTKIKSIPQRFKVATVFVFSISGELLLEKDLPLEIKTGGT
ncbi:MAG: hypothetical protein Q8N95_09865 [Desulfobacterales bacterium]|nr:hypothetical protein [Desulfobacterales bacterium]